MTKSNLKISVIALAIGMFAVSCNSGGGKRKAETPETAEQATSAKSGLFNISDGQIIAYKIEGSKQVALAGDERTKMLAAIPAEIKKGVGELMPGIATVQKNLVTGAGYIVGFGFKISGKDDYAALKDYYKTLGGTITKEGEIEGAAWLEINFSWGQLTQCEHGDITKSITVSFSIN